MKKMRLSGLIALTAVLAACSSPRHSAPVVDQSPAARPAAPPVSNSSGNAPAVADPHGYYTVRKGDTLVRIALEFGQNYRDIVAWNNLSNPNDIKVGQALRILPPENNNLNNAVQTGSVATTSGVEVRPLTATPMPVAPSTVPNKTWPRGDKLPYSENALAELQKPDVSAVAAPAEVKPAVLSSQSPQTVADEVSWGWPTEGKVTASYEEAKKGIDIEGKLGQPIFAAGAGTVLYASSVRGYGNLVIIKHTNDLLSAYAHNQTILVKEGQSVTKGQKIAEMGNSDTDKVKLHFEIRRGGKPVDPSKFLPNR